jgi:hypothetical protein
MSTILQDYWRTIVFIVSATTNSAAAQVQGDKIHSIAGLRDYHFFREGQIN